MPLNLQSKLLRVLQEKTIRRIGAKKDIPFDIKIIAASNQNMDELVRFQKFRNDLFYRLNVIPLHIPPLKERKEDILILADFFLNRYSQRYQKSLQAFSDTAKEQICQYFWPGNIRELENAVEYAVNMGTNHQIELSDLPPLLSEIKKGNSLEDRKKEIERSELIGALDQHGWDLAGKTLVAETFNISVRTLYRKIKLLNIEKNKQSN